MKLLVISEEVWVNREIASADGQTYDVVTRSYLSEEEDWVWYITRLHPQGNSQVTLRRVCIVTPRLRWPKQLITRWWVELLRVLGKQEWKNKTKAPCSAKYLPLAEINEGV